jgi:uncharacterized delta-60 repeat protein
MRTANLSARPHIRSEKMKDRKSLFQLCVPILCVAALTEQQVMAKAPGGGGACPAITPLNPPITSPTSPPCANSGCADTSFNGTGFEITNTDGSVPKQTDIDSASAVVQIAMPDGSTRILAIGTTTSPTAGVGQGIALVRYNSDGTPDTAFGNGGIVELFLPIGSSSVTDGLLDAQGNIVVLAGINGKSAVVRLHPDGTLDTTFNGSGYVSTNVDPKALLFDPAGNILVGGAVYVPLSGNRTAQYGGVARLTPGGVPDSTFGQGGLSVLSSLTIVQAVAIETVNSAPYLLVGAGSTVARLTPAGAIDPTFAAGTGSATTNVCGYGYSIRVLRLDTAGNILAIGHGSVISGGVNKIVVARFTPSGVLDTSFGLSASSGGSKTGFTVLDMFGYSNIATTAAIYTDGSGDIAVGGYANFLVSQNVYDTYATIMKISSTGALVGAFNNSHGAVALDWGSANNYTTPPDSHGLLIEPSDGKLVLGGTSGFVSGPYTGYNFVVARLWP